MRRYMQDYVSRRTRRKLGINLALFYSILIDYSRIFSLPCVFLHLGLFTLNHVPLLFLQIYFQILTLGSNPKISNSTVVADCGNLLFFPKLYLVDPQSSFMVTIRLKARELAAAN